MSENKNKIVVASAGSGKTTGIINVVNQNLDKNTLVTTYTNSNVKEIVNKFYGKFGLGYVPDNVEISSLKAFLLREGVKPYQNYLIDVKKGKIKSIDFKSLENNYKNKKSRKYYLNNNNDVYNNKITEFIVECNAKSNNLIIDRLEKIYDMIIIDEIQDINGKYDFEFIELLLKSKIEVLLVGDHRQAIISTNTTAKTKVEYKGIHIINKFCEWESSGLCNIEYSSISYRCCQKICDFADKLFPETKKRTISKRDNIDKDEGIFIVKKDEEAIRKYYKKYKSKGDKIQALRPNKKELAYNLNPLNIGLAKGKTYDRVIIFFTKGLDDYLSNADFKFADKTCAQFYVALTRTRKSVLLVSDVPIHRFEEIRRIKSSLDVATLFDGMKY